MGQGLFDRGSGSCQSSILMTCTYGGFVFALIASTAFDAIIIYYFIFNLYCARIAKLEGRQEEFRSLHSLEGGMNFFELEQAAKIWRQEHKKFNDSELNRLAKKLFVSGFFGLTGMVSAALWLAYLMTEICNVS